MAKIKDFANYDFGRIRFSGTENLDETIVRFCTDPKILEIRKELEKASKDKLELIIKEYRSAPLLKRAIRGSMWSVFLRKWSDGYEENSHRYHIAKIILDGTYDEHALITKYITKGIQTKLERFPGSLEEFERLKKIKYEIIDTGKTDKGFLYDLELGGRLETFYEVGKLDIEALVNCKNFYYSKWGGFGGKSIFSGAKGIPVRKISTSK